MDNRQGEPIIVHVLTGFLGSGKTSLLNLMLEHPEFYGSAVIINEFGEVGLDHHLVETADDSIIELANGCLCCTVRGKLVETLENLVERMPDRILIETTGIADPAPVLQVLVATPQLEGRIRPGSLVCVFDGLEGEKVVERHEEARRQLGLADVVVVSKLDALADDEAVRRQMEIGTCVGQHNPSAFLATRDGFLDNPAEWLSRTAQANHISICVPSATHVRHSGIDTVLLRSQAPTEAHNLELFLDLLLSAHGDHVVRIKGLASIAGQDRPLLIQAVGRRMSEPVYLEKWPETGPETALVVFLDGLDRQLVRKLFEGFLGAPAVDTPDRAALLRNPLAIPGFSGKN